MIWRLTYCNKEGVEARIDVIKGDRTSVEVVQGSGNPFTLSYKLDKNDKSGHIMTSSADIEIYETDTFNIDDLKTSNETELKVEYFEDNVLTWSGFILPDFFSREIGSPNIVRMTASDRLTALKGVTLSDLPSRVSLRDLIELSLAQTGLSLGLVSQIQINQGSTNILDSEILSQRFTDVKGRSISCYDILLSIMVGTNSTIRQRAGQWQVYNKLEHELRTPTIFFDKVEKGAMRTIQPVASSVGVYQEYGGGRLHPDNYDFAQGGSGWVSKNGFSYTISNQKPASYSTGVPNHTVTFGESDRNRMMIMGIVLPFWQPDTAPHVENKFPVITSNEDSVKITIDISVLGWGYWGAGSTGRFIILAENDNSRLAFNPNSGHFEEFDNEAISPNSSEPPYVIKLKPSASKVGEAYPVTSKSIKYETVLEKANLSDYTISIRIYRTSGFTGPTAPLFINFANIRFSNTEEAPRGTLFKTTQGSNFTKLHDVETTIFGDYITSGLNGYFYNYSIDDTSSLHLPNGELSPPQWITAFDTTERPLLHHISRQKSRLFSVAHDILKANINVESFDPLAIFQDCKGGKYVVVSANFDFLRSEVNVELEQIAEDTTIFKRDFIYSYFGEGEDTIKSIGGISGGGGGGGTGGGLTPEQLEILSFWKKDPDRENTIFTEMNAYSTKELSAYGLGSGSGGGGGDGTHVEWGTTANNYSPLIVEGVSKTVALLGHTHTKTEIGLGNVLNVASYSKTESDGRFAPLTGFNSHVNDNIRHITGAERVKWDGVVGDFNKKLSNRYYFRSHYVLDITYWKIATIPEYSNWTASAIYVETTSKKSATNLGAKMKVMLGNRNTLWYNKSYYNGKGQAHIIAYEQLDGSLDVYAYTPNLNQYSSLDVSYYEFGWDSGITFYDAPSPTTTVPTGVSVFDSNNDLLYPVNATIEAKLEYVNLLNAPTSLSQFTDNIGVATHIANKANPHSVTKAQVGLGNVDNTSDLLKPISTATQTALNLKANLASPTFTGTSTFGVRDGLKDNVYVNRLAILPPSHSGTWHISTKDDASKAYVAFRYGTSEVLKLSHTGEVAALTSVTSPKVIFAAAGWSMEQVGSELQIKHNNVLKMRFTSAGSIVATEEITAFG